MLPQAAELARLVAKMGRPDPERKGSKMSQDADDAPAILTDREARRAAKKGMFKRAVAQVSGMAQTTVKQGDGFVQHLYDDYETYRRVQEEGNKAKLRAQFVKKGHIFYLANWMQEARAGPITFGICHGVRRGKEQAWFARKLAGANVIGTDISQTATEFENTVQWDFHDDNPEWQGRADFIYSNSWDHAYDPGKAFAAWARCLKAGGWLLIDHTRGHMPKSSNVLDPFGATRDAVIRILGESCGDLGSVVEVLDRTGDEEYPSTVIVFQRGSAAVESAPAVVKPAPTAKAAVAKPKAAPAAKPKPATTAKPSAAAKKS